MVGNQVARIPLAIGIREGEDLKTMPFRVHLLNYFPDWVPNAGELFDAESLCESLVEAKVNSVEFVAKDHTGKCYYMTEIGPRPKRDWLGEFVKAARPRGIEVLAYYSLAWDTHAAITHPDWSQMTKDGKPYTGSWLFKNVCPNTPYREYVIDQIHEIVSKYDVDGIWLDLVDWAPCYCEHCKKKYKALFGEDIPHDPRANPEDSVRFEEFWGETRISLISAIEKIIKKEKPHALLSFNGAGKFGMYKGKMSSFTSFHSREGTMGPEFLSRVCKALSPQHKPYELIAPGGKGWFSWSPRPAGVLKLESAIVYAHGGSLTISVNPFPDGSISHSEVQNISRVFSWIEARRKCFEGKISAGLSDIGILWTKYTPRGVFVQGEEGISKALLEGHHLFEVVQEGSELSRYSLLILPSGTYLQGEMEEHVRQFVYNGGRLLSFSTAGLVDQKGERLDNFSISDILGVDYNGMFPHSACYIDITDPQLRKEIIEYPLLTTYPATRIESRDSDVLAEAVPPIADLDDSGSCHNPLPSRQRHLRIRFVRRR